MEGKRLAVYIVGGALIATGLGFGIYFLVKKPDAYKGKDAPKDNAPSQPKGGSSSSGSQASTQVQTQTTNIFPLVIGSSGDTVKTLQNALNAKYSAGLNANGNLGEDTMKAVCSKVFRYCFTATSDYKDIKIDRILFNDIQAGRTRTDLSIPTT